MRAESADTRHLRRQLVEFMPPLVFRDPIRHERKIPRAETKPMLKEQRSDRFSTVSTYLIVQWPELRIQSAETMSLGKCQTFLKGKILDADVAGVE